MALQRPHYIEWRKGVFEMTDDVRDGQLLQRYKDGDESAFAEIVRRYAGVVHGSCLRVLGNEGDAQDAAQAAFLLLAKKAKGLDDSTPLAAWLYRTARLAALDARKMRARRARHEEEAAKMNPKRANEEAGWQDVAPLIDTAIAALPTGQRQAVVLRYGRGLSEQEVADEMGLKRTTVAMRIKSALEKLRRKLSREGVALPAAGLAGLLSQGLSVAAPAGLVSGITAACAAGGAAATGAAVEIAKGAAKTMLMKQVTTVTLTVALVGSVGGGGWVAGKQLLAGEPAKTAEKQKGTPSKPTNGNGLDWPQWRGPTRDGKSPMSGIRKDWTGGLKKLWEVKGLSPDTGTYASPSIQGDRLIVCGKTPRDETTRKKQRPMTVYCFDADKGGKPLWKKRFPDDYTDYGWGLGVSASPAIDGDKVYIARRSKSGVLCLSMADGKELWNHQVRTAQSHGYSAGPLVWQDLVIVPGLMYKKNGIRIELIGALKKATGEIVWTFTPEKVRHGHSSPSLAVVNGREQILFVADKLACGLDPRTGKALWKYESSVFDSRFYSVPGMLTAGDIICVPCNSTEKGKGPWPHGVQVTEQGVKAIWKGFVGNKREYRLSMGDGIEVDGFIYTFTSAAEKDQPNHDRGFHGAGSSGYLICIDPKTGQVQWEVDTGCGLMIYVDGCLLCQTFRGDLFLVDPSAQGFRKITEWKGAIPLSKWYFEGRLWRKGPQPCWTTPVVARGKLYIRYHDRLTCYDLRK